MDDVLDYYSSEKEFGKTIGKDLQEGSVTLPFIEALERSESEDGETMTHIIRRKHRGEDELSVIIDLIEKYKGSVYAVEKAKQYSKKAIDSLKIFDDDMKKKPLIELAEYVVGRKF